MQNFNQGPTFKHHNWVSTAGDVFGFNGQARVDLAQLFKSTRYVYFVCNPTGTYSGNAWGRFISGDVTSPTPFDLDPSTYDDAIELIAGRFYTIKVPRADQSVANTTFWVCGVNGAKMDFCALEIGVHDGY